MMTSSSTESVSIPFVVCFTREDWILMDLEGLDSGAIGWLFTLPLQTTRYSPQDVLVGGCSTGVQYSRNERSTRVVNSQQLNSFHSFKQQIYTDNATQHDTQQEVFRSMVACCHLSNAPYSFYHPLHSPNST